MSKYEQAGGLQPGAPEQTTTDFVGREQIDRDVLTKQLLNHLFIRAKTPNTEFSANFRQRPPYKNLRLFIKEQSELLMSELSETEIQILWLRLNRKRPNSTIARELQIGIEDIRKLDAQKIQERLLLKIS